jgi:hypothetical protein
LYVCMYVYTRMEICVYVGLFEQHFSALRSVYVCMCMYVCMYVCIHSQIYLYT